MGETPMKRNLNDVSEVELNFVGFRGIGESIERFLRCSFDLFDNTDDLLIAASSIKPRGRYTSRRMSL
jgi:hypothetical protein